MNHLAPFIVDLALILITAAITTLLFSRLRLPLVVGYILAGFLVGPNADWIPTVSNMEGVRLWADLGVVIILFGLGLEFSFKKLAKVGGSSGLTGLIELGGMLMLGYFTGRALGWDGINSLYLGGIIAISSTTIIFRAFEEMGLKSKQFTSLVMGVLIVEDVVAVLLLVVLSTLAVSKESAGVEMLIALGKLIFLIALWFIVGIYSLPTVFKRAARWLTPETLLVTGLGLCLGMVVFADSVGFSMALGAFVMGSLLSETIYGEKLEKLMDPLRSLFGAIFFVSVGMLIDPASLLTHYKLILLLAGLVILGKLVFVTIGALAAGRPLHQAVQAGSSMTQIGEFSFIIATLGSTLNATNNYLYPLAVGVSVITIFTTPYLIRSSGNILAGLKKMLPEKWWNSLESYSAGTQVLKSESDWRRLIRTYLQVILVNSVIILTLILIAGFGLREILIIWLENVDLTALVSLAISMLIILPFLWAIIDSRPQRTAWRRLWMNSAYNHGPLVGLEIGRFLLAFFYVAILVRIFYPLNIALAVSLVFVIAALLLLRRKLNRFYGRLQDRFVANLKGKDHVPHKLLAPWDAHVAEFVIPAGSPYAGKTLAELAWREDYDLNIAFIIRDERVIHLPDATRQIFPFDKVGVIGTDEQMLKINELLEENILLGLPLEFEYADVELIEIVVDAKNGLQGKTIRENRIRERTMGLVVGLERKGIRRLNPHSDTMLEWNDILWIAGQKEKILKGLENHPEKMVRS